MYGAVSQETERDGERRRERGRNTYCCAGRVMVVGSSSESCTAAASVSGLSSNVSVCSADRTLTRLCCDPDRDGCCVCCAGAVSPSSPIWNKSGRASACASSGNVSSINDPRHKGNRSWRRTSATQRVDCRALAICSEYTQSDINLIHVPRIASSTCRGEALLSGGRHRSPRSDGSNVTGSNRIRDGDRTFVCGAR